MVSDELLDDSMSK